MHRHFQRIQAIGADQFAFEKRDVVHVAAKDARRLVFFEYYRLFVDKNFDRITTIHIERSSYFDRKNYSSEFVYFSYYSGRFQQNLP